MNKYIVTYSKPESKIIFADSIKEAEETIKKSLTNEKITVTINGNPVLFESRLIMIKEEKIVEEHKGMTYDDFTS